MRLGVFYSAVKAFQCGGEVDRLIASFVVPHILIVSVILAIAGRSFVH